MYINLFKNFIEYKQCRFQKEAAPVKNNLIAFLYHIVAVIFSFIFLIFFVSTGPTLGKYFTHILMRIILIIIFTLSYMYIGMFLDSSKDKKYDFLVGGLIGIIGIAIWIYILLLTGGHLIKVPKEVASYWIPYNVYYTPFLIVDFLLGIPHNPALAFFQNFLPSVLIGIGLKRKRKILSK